MVVVFWGLCVCVTILIGSLHVYWGFGGIKFMKGVLPEYKYGYRPQLFYKKPGLFICLLVSLAFYILALLMIINHFTPSIQLDFLLKIAMLIFVLRFIGEYNCLGLFKRERDTLFAKLDYYVYMPYCVYMVASLYVQIYYLV